jgi:hypothetical protein
MNGKKPNMGADEMKHTDGQQEQCEALWTIHAKSEHIKAVKELAAELSEPDAKVSVEELMAEAVKMLLAYYEEEESSDPDVAMQFTTDDDVPEMVSEMAERAGVSIFEYITEAIADRINYDLKREEAKSKKPAND